MTLTSSSTEQRFLFPEWERLIKQTVVEIERELRSRRETSEDWKNAFHEYLLHENRKAEIEKRMREMEAFIAQMRKDATIDPKSISDPTTI